MKHKIISVTQAKLSELTKSVYEDGFAYLLTKDGNPVSVLVPVEEYEAFLETENLSNNINIMDDLRSALADEKNNLLWKRDKKGKWVKVKKSKTAA